MRWLFGVYLLVLTIAPAVAVQPDEIMTNPVLEERARGLSAELRCLVCQNQSIDDSAAPLARDLRLLVRERLAAGDSDRDVKAFLVSRYGPFILLKPPLSLATLALWGTPAAAFLVGLAAVLLRRQKGRTTAVAPLTEEEAIRLAELTGSRPSS